MKSIENNMAKDNDNSETLVKVYLSHSKLNF